MRSLLLLALVACAPDPTDPAKPPDDTDDSPPPPPPEVVSESFEYYPPQLDLVFLVDEDEWQYTLAPALDDFVTALEERDIDFHLGVTGVYRQADGTAGVLSALGAMRWGEKSHAGAADFLRAAMIPITDDGDPCGTWAARGVIENAVPDGPNAGFLRPGSELALVVVSDEPDRSNAFGYHHNEFVEYLRAQREDPEEVSFHAITRPHDQAGPQYYMGVVNSFGGCLHSLDEPPFLPTLQCVVDTVEPTNVFALEGDAVSDTLSVVVHEPGLGEVELTADQFAYDEAASVVHLLGYYPRYSAVVEIRYVER